MRETQMALLVGLVIALTACGSEPIPNVEDYNGSNAVGDMEDYRDDIASWSRDVGAAKCLDLWGFAYWHHEKYDSAPIWVRLRQNSIHIVGNAGPTGRRIACDINKDDGAVSIDDISYNEYCEDRYNYLSSNNDNELRHEYAKTFEYSNWSDLVSHYNDLCAGDAFNRIE